MTSRLVSPLPYAKSSDNSVVVLQFTILLLIVRSDLCLAGRRCLPAVRLAGEGAGGSDARLSCLAQTPTPPLILVSRMPCRVLNIYKTTTLPGPIDSLTCLMPSLIAR